MPQSVIEILEQTAARYPQAIALAQEDMQLTFLQLRTLARGVGQWLVERGIARQAIGVAAVQSVYTPVLFFGVAYAGGCYVPLNLDTPEEKLQKIGRDSQMPVVLTWNNADCAAAKSKNLPAVAMERLDLNVDDVRLPDLSPEMPLYLIYTSGSTGQPKGIVKSHGAVLSFMQAYMQIFDFCQTDVVGNQTPFFFDASAKDLYMMVAAGCRLELIPRRLFLSPVKLVEYLNEKHVTIISWVPSALSMISQFHTFQTVMPKTLRRVMFVGEVFPMKQLNRWRESCPELDYVNLYGSSEIAGVCCCFPVVGSFADDDSLPVGKALPNCQVVLVADGQVVTRPDVLGEIHVASDALAEGYLHDTEKTSATFPVLLLDGVSPRRYLKTGDLARYDHQGNLVFAARSDFQIKHMGHRIELGEIETAAAALPEISACCCIYDTKRKKIILYVQAPVQTRPKEIQLALRQRLTDYMVPSKVVVLQQLPMNANGKIDRVALKNYKS